MKRSYLTAAIIALATLGWLFSSQIPGLDGQQEDGDATAGDQVARTADDETARMSVSVIDVDAADFDSHILLTGRTEAQRKVDLKAEINGRVQEVLVARGAWVEEGDPIVRIDVDDRGAALAEARAAERQRQIEYDAAEELAQQGFEARIRLAQAEAQLDAARAQRLRAEIAFGNTTIAAPFSGTVDDRMVELGDYVTVGMPVARLIDLDPLKVTAKISERNLGRLQPDDPGEVRLYNGDVLSARLTHIGAVADPQTRTIPVQMELDNPAGGIAEGVTAELRLPVETRQGHQVPPSALTLNDAGQVGLRLVDAEGIVRFQPVEILAHRDGVIWVSGLPETATIIIRGQEYVRAGEPVEAVREDQDTDNLS